MDLDKLLALIPQIATWVFPGVVFSFTYTRTSSNKFSLADKDHLSIITVLFWSYTSQLVVSALSQLTLMSFLSDDTNKAIAQVVFAFLFGILAGFIIHSEWFEKIIAALTHRTIEDNVWFGMADKKHGCYARVYLKDQKVTYFGEYRRYYEHSGTTWIVLERFSIEGEDGKDLDSNTITTSTQNNCLYAVALCEKDINRVEFLYPSET